MPVPFPSALIRYERLRRNWSLEGLCEGICAVSYLSKIEQGKADPSPEIVHALMQRLDLVWYDGEEAREAAALVEEIIEAEISCETERLNLLYQELNAKRDIFLNTPSMLDIRLLDLLHGEMDAAEQLDKFEHCFDERQRALWLVAQGRAEEALMLMGCAWIYRQCGFQAYEKGSYMKAAERLQWACTLAGEEGRARVMLTARTMLGNCYSCMGDIVSMRRHYQIAQRLARSLGEEELLQTIDYNMASTNLELGYFEEAYTYFSTCGRNERMALHKLAICLEKMGKREEALKVILCAEEAPCDLGEPGLGKQICWLVRYRLEHPDYLHHEQYGKALFQTFEQIRLRLPMGYALFHLQWMEEWYKANRQYKRAYELLSDFSRFLK